MATLLHLFRGSGPALAVSAPNLFASRANFLHNIVPAFPAAKAFTPHFCDSYALIRAVSQESSEPLPVGFGLLSLGVKGHELLPASFYKPLMYHLGLLEPLGLSFRMMKSGGMEVFNPAAIRPQLQSILKRSLPNLRAMNAGLADFAALNTAKPSAYPYELLGWPSLVAPNEEFAIHSAFTYNGQMQFASKPDEFVKVGLLVSAAVAVVEQILGKLKSLPKIGTFFTESAMAPT